MADEWQDEYLAMIQDCEQREGMLSDWERGFIDSLAQQIGRGKVPTPKQVDRLNDAWERVTARG